MPPTASLESQTNFRPKNPETIYQSVFRRSQFALQTVCFPLCMTDLAPVPFPVRPFRAAG